MGAGTTCGSCSLNANPDMESLMRAEVFGSFSDTSEPYGGGLQVAMPF